MAVQDFKHAGNTDHKHVGGTNHKHMAGSTVKVQAHPAGGILRGLQEKR